MSAARRSRTQKAVLIVLFIPSVDRDETSIDQDRWTARALEVLGILFGGATAFPRARGVWRDDERDERLVWDEPVVIHCYASAPDVRQERKQRVLGEFCNEMGRATNPIRFQ
jgi:hypothetical protein